MSKKKNTKTTTPKAKTGSKGRKAVPNEVVTTTEVAVEQPMAEERPEPGTPTEPVAAEQAVAGERVAEAPSESTPTPAVDVADAATPKQNRKTRKQKEPREKKVSAIDAAARVLAEEGKPMNCKEMIETMAAKGYWASPSGQTPAATLYSAILREISKKGAESRFKKTERGQFARTDA